VEVSIPYGRRQLKFKLPASQVGEILELQCLPGVKDGVSAVRKAVCSPIGSPRLREIARPGKKITIVINDVTRPAPSRLMVEELTRELGGVGVRDREISLLIATGSHRPTTREELNNILDPGLLERFRIKNHDCKDGDALFNTGVTKNGMRVTVNKLVSDADIKILTGVITPHQTAGYSGGRKSVIPGIAGLSTLRAHHSFPIRPFGEMLGILNGNRFHEEALEAAKMCRIDFILNAVLNDKKETVKFVAGDLEAAHLAGAELCARMVTVDLGQQSDIVITSPGGYPRDLDLYQAQKAVAVAELAVKNGGVIILAAKCEKGLGGERMVAWLREAADPQEVIRRFGREGYYPGTNKAFLYARALCRAKIIVVSDSLSEQDLESLFFLSASRMEQALQMAGEHVGPNPSIVIIPNGCNVIPVKK